MVISQIIGGLGNQMFQYAAGRALSLRLGSDLKLDVSAFDTQVHHQGFELARIFAASPSVASAEDLRAVLGWQRFGRVRTLLARKPLAAFRSQRFAAEPHFHFWPGFDALHDDVYLSGYWQSDKYFKSVVAQIREDFRFKLPLQGENAALADRLAKSQAVSLHVRRGDYASNPKTTATHGLCSIDYYHAAVQRIASTVDKPEFIVFSDEIEWVKANLPLDFPHRFVAHNQGAASYNDMRLMSLCRHHVIANSSFSWWGAWLNPSPEKIVVAPRRWFANDNDVRDLFPDGCVLL